MDDKHQELELARARAKEALSGKRVLSQGEIRPEEKLDPEYINRRRQEAVLALEGNERRQKREQENRRRQQLAETKEKLASLANKKKQTTKPAPVTNHTETSKQETQEEQNRRKEKLRREQASLKLLEQLKNERETKLSPLRTIKSDVAKTAEAETWSATRVAMANSDTYQTSKINFKIYWVLGLSLLLIIGGSGAGYLAWRDWRYGGATPEINPAQLAIIPADWQIKINLDHQTNDEIKKLIKQGSSEEGKNSGLGEYVIEEATVTKNSAGEQATSTLPIKTERMLSLFDINYRLSRLFRDRFMLGTSQTGTTQDNFLALPLDNYEGLLSLLLSQEALTLKPFVDLLRPDILPDLPNLDWQDQVIANQEVRVLSDGQANILACYSVFNREIFILIVGPNSKQSFTNIIERYTNSRS